MKIDMPRRRVKFVNGGFYHVYNRGLQKQIIFKGKRDYSRFLETVFYYQIENPKPKFSTYHISKLFPIDDTKKIVEILCYCLMPNHFHLLLQQRRDNGVSEFMRRFTHSYVNYRNVKYGLQGPVFQGVFKTVPIETDEQLLHVSRYIHLNPTVASLIEDPELYQWSSCKSYITNNDLPINTEEILGLFNSTSDYRRFINDQKDYATTLEILKHSTIDD